MTPLTVTLAQMREHIWAALPDQVNKGEQWPYVATLGEPIPLTAMLDEGWFNWTVWCLQVHPVAARLFAADCANRVLPLWLARYPDDARPAQAIEMARRYARGGTTDVARTAAWDAARKAAWDAWRRVTGCEYAARDAARAAARAAGADWPANDDVWLDDMAETARTAVVAVAWERGEDAARAEEEWQTARLRLYCEGVDPGEHATIPTDDETTTEGQFTRSSSDWWGRA